MSSTPAPSLSEEMIELTIFGKRKKDTASYHESYFVDTLLLNQATHNGDAPIATYLVGTTAQCTWLQKKGHLPRTTPAFKSCVARFGVGKFNSSQCK
jgi:hypothetical protein